MTAVVTGEAVALDLRHAGLPSRMLATAIDLLLQVVLLVVVSVPLQALGLGLDGAAQAALGVVLLVTVLVGYPVALETVWRGRTPGKAALGLRVVRADSGPVGFRQALARGLAAAFVEKPGLTFFSGAVFSMIFTPRSQRLGDLLAGTVVIADRTRAPTPAPAAMPAPLAAWAAAADLGAVPDAVLSRARDVLGRAPNLTPAVRERWLRETADAVGAAVAPPPPPGTPPWALLAAVLAERRRRATPSAAVPERTAPAATDTSPSPAARPPTSPAPDAPPAPTRHDPPARTGSDGGFAPLS